jgi:predicted nucleotidyltransferase
MRVCPFDSGDLAARLRDLFERQRPGGVVAVYLFGSHAARRAHAESDIDLGVLLRYERFPTSRERFEERLRLHAWLAGELGTDALDLVILNDAPPHLARHVVRAGECLSRTDAEAEHAFVRDVQLRAADMEPFLRRARRVKLAALAP